MSETCDICGFLVVPDTALEIHLKDKHPERLDGLKKTQAAANPAPKDAAWGATTTAAPMVTGANQQSAATMKPAKAGQPKDTWPTK